MREIKFRGQAFGTREWVYGNLRRREDGGNFIETIDAKHCFPILPETIGQFTGLYDKNGKEIYEGDIIEYSYIICEEDGVGTYLSEITFIDGVFCIENDADSTVFYIQWASEDYGGIEVIGNVYDNSELLKGGEE